MNEPTEPRPGESRETSPPARDVAAHSIRSEELLRGGREVLIEHEGVFYRLRLTRNGKLILQK